MSRHLISTRAKLSVSYYVLTRLFSTGGGRASFELLMLRKEDTASGDAQSSLPSSCLFLHFSLPLLFSRTVSLCLFCFSFHITFSQILYQDVSEIPFFPPSPPPVLSSPVSSPLSLVVPSPLLSLSLSFYLSGVLGLIAAVAFAV